MGHEVSSGSVRQPHGRNKQRRKFAKSIINEVQQDLATIFG